MEENILESQDNHDNEADQVTSSGEAISPTQCKVCVLPLSSGLPLQHVCIYIMSSMPHPLQARSKISKKVKLKRLQEGTRGSESKSPLGKGKKRRQKTKAQLTELISA